jgi:Bacterial Ig-like domain
MRKTLLLFTTMALTLLLAAGMAWAALPAPTVSSTVPANGTTGVLTDANITATFSEAMSTKSLGICNHCTSTSSSKTFYLLRGNFTALSPTKNPPRFCTNTATGTTAPCPTPIPATVSYNAGTFTAILNPSSTLLPNTTYTAVVEGTADGDFVAVKDTGGTPMATDYIFHFTTAP